jgi:hypothetical protein
MTDSVAQQIVHELSQIKQALQAVAIILQQNQTQDAQSKPAPMTLPFLGQGRPR